MPNNEYSSENENELRYYTVKILHKFFFNKRDFLPDSVEVTNADLQAGLLRDKKSIRINKNQIDDLNTIAEKTHKHGELDSDGAMRVQTTGGGFKVTPNANVITDANGYLTTEAKISTVSPNNSIENIKPDSFDSAQVGISNYYARADHVHKQEHDNTKANVNHSHQINDITNLSSNLSNITNTLNSHSHGIIQNNGVINGASNKNIVTNSNGSIIVEDKPTIPQGYTNIPSADSANGSAGNSTTWAKGNHSHPQSNLYAPKSHTHKTSEILSSSSTTTNLDTLLSQKASSSHSHGIILNDGKVLNNNTAAGQNKNLITDSSGNITLEDKIDLNDFNNLQSNMDKLSWINVRQDYNKLPDFDSSSSVVTSSRISAFYVNIKLRLCFIRVQFSVTVRDGNLNKWNTVLTIPKYFGPTWTRYLTPHGSNFLVRIVDDDGTGDNHTDKRALQYLPKSTSVDTIIATGFYIYTNTS